MRVTSLPVIFLVAAASIAAAQEPQSSGPDAVGGQRAPQQAPAVVRGEAANPQPLQGVQALDSGSITIPIHTQQADPVGGAYGIWAAGNKYKVSFHDGMTFVPYLGSGYPNNQPFGWRTTSVRVGGQELLGASEQPAHQQGQFQYRYQFGKVTEVYDVRADGLEQSFVLAERPAVLGDLLIEGRITSALHAQPVAAGHQALRFLDAQEQHILTYGEAFAIDANGNKTNAATMLDGDRIRLQVDGTWLAGAAFPVTVDPILTPTRIDFGSLRESVDICRDDTANDRMYVFIRTASATDKDIYARIVEDDFSAGAYVFSDVNTGWSHDQVRVATADSPQKYCAVFDRLFSNNTSAIRCHVHDSGDLTSSTTVFFLNWSSTIQDWRPDVGGTLAGSSGNKFLIAFQRDAGATLVNTANSEVWAVTLDISGASPVEGTRFELFGSGPVGDYDVERPAVNKQATPGTTTIWMVVWQEYANGAALDDWDTEGRLVDSNDNASASLWFTLAAASQTHHQLGPVVAGASGRYCVGYSMGDLTLINFKTGLINGTSVDVERVNWTGLASAPTRFQAHRLWGQHSDRRWRVSDIGYDSNSDSHWAISSVSDRAYVAAATGNTYIDRVGFNGLPLESATLYSAPANFSGDPGGVAFDDDANQMVTAWAQNDLTALPTTLGSAHEIYGTSFEYPAPATTPSTSGLTCSAAPISWTPGSFNSGQQIGHEFTGISVSGTPAGSVHFILVSLATQNALVINPAVAAGCHLLVQESGPNYLGTMPIEIGGAIFAPLKLYEYLGPIVVYFQDWYINPTDNLVYSTQRLRVEVIK